MRKLNYLLVFVLVVGLALTSVHIISAQMQQQGGRQRGTSQQQRPQMDPAEMLNRMLERTMGQLNLSEEETTVLQPMVKGLLEERMNQGTKRRELINALREAIDAKNSEQVQGKLKEIKDLRQKKHTEKTDKMEKDLVELLTVAQEAQLTVAGIVNSDGSGLQFGGGFRQQGMPGGMQRGNRPGGGDAGGGGAGGGRQRPQ